MNIKKENNTNDLQNSGILSNPINNSGNDSLQNSGFIGNPVNNSGDDILPRKRGRPRKNQIVDLTTISKMVDKPKPVKDLENREIILKMPLFSQKSIKNLTKQKLSSDERSSDRANSDNYARSSDRVNSENYAKNAFTMNDDSTDDFTHNDKDNNTNSNTDLLLSLTENDLNHSISDNDSTDSDIDINELLDEIKKKDKLIKQLKIELTELQTIMPVSYSMGKDVKIIPMNLSFLSSKTGKTMSCEKTDIACWWCTYQFNNLPCFIPERYNDNSFYVFGCFCSFNCASAYNINLGDYKVFDRNSLIKQLWRTITGKNDEIPIAPPKEILIKYGGTKTIEEFRQNDKSLVKEYRLLLPPMINLVSCIEEKTKDRMFTNSHKSTPEVKRVVIDESNMTPVKKKNTEAFADIMESVGIKEIIRKKSKF